MKTIALLHWTPRILGILAILFISMFSLDVFDGKEPFMTQLGGWFIHMIPSWVLIALLVVAWKWEKAGGIIFLSLGLAFTPFIFWGNYMGNHSVWMSLVIVLTITFPLILTGGLFMLSHHAKKQASELVGMIEKKGG